MIASGDRRAEVIWDGDNKPEVVEFFGPVEVSPGRTFEIFVNPRWVTVNVGDVVFRDAAGEVHVDKLATGYKI